MQLLSNPNVLDKDLTSLEVFITGAIDNQYTNVLSNLFLSNAPKLNKLKVDSKDSLAWADSFAKSKEIQGLSVFISTALDYLWDNAIFLGTSHGEKELSKADKILDFMRPNLRTAIEFAEKRERESSRWNRDEVELGRLSEALLDEDALKTYRDSENIKKTVTNEQLRNAIQNRIERKINPYLQKQNINYSDLDTTRQRLILRNLSDSSLSGKSSEKLSNIRQLTEGYIQEQPRPSKPQTGKRNQAPAIRERDLKNSFNSFKYLYDRTSPADTTINATETRERMRTLTEGYPEFKNPIWQEYISKRKGTLARNLTEDYQNKIKEETLGFIRSRDLDSMQKYLDRNFRGTRIPIKEYDSIREDINRLTYSRSLSQETLKQLYKEKTGKDLKLTKESARRLNNFEKSTSAQNYVESIKKIRKDSRKDIINEISQLQTNSKVPYTKELRDSYSKTLERMVGTSFKGLSEEDKEALAESRATIQDYDEEIKQVNKRLSSKNLRPQELRGLQDRLSLLTSDREIELEDVRKLTQDQVGSPQEGLINKQNSRYKDLIRQRTNFLTGKTLPLSTQQQKQLNKIDRQISVTNKSLQIYRQERDKSRNELEKLKKADQGNSIRPEPETLIKIPEKLQDKIRRMLGKDVIPADGRVKWSNLDNIKSGIRTNEFWENEEESVRRIGTTEISAAYNIGRLASFLNDPEIEYLQWVSVLDSRTSVFCQRLNGRVFHREDFANIVMSQVFPNTKLPDYSPENIKLAPGFSKFGGYPVWISPAHPYCRSYLQPIRSSKKREELLDALTVAGLSLEGKALVSEKAGKKMSRQVNAVVNLTQKLATSLSNLRTADQLFRQGFNLIQQRFQDSKESKSREEKKPVDEKAIQTALLGATAVIGGGALYYFFFKSRLDQKMRDYIQETSTTMGTSAAIETMSSILDSLRKAEIPSLPAGVERKLQERAQESLNLIRSNELEQLLQPSLEPQRNAERLRRMRALVADPNVNVQDIPKLLSGASNLPREVTRRLYGDIINASIDVVNDLEKQGQDILARAINATSRADLDGQITIFRDPNSNRFRAQTSTGKSSFISRRYLEDPEFQSQISRINLEADILEQNLQEIQSLIDTTDIKSRRSIEAQLKNLQRMRTYGTFRTQPQRLSPVQKQMELSDPRRLQKVDNFYNQISGEIDSLRNIQSQGLDVAREYADRYLVSEGQLNSIISAVDYLPREALIKVRENITLALEGIQRDLVQGSSRDLLGDLKDPFADVKNLTIDQNLRGLRELNEIVELGDASSILEDFRQDYFSELRNQIQRLLDADSIIREKLRN